MRIFFLVSLFFLSFTNSASSSVSMKDYIHLYDQFEKAESEYLKGLRFFYNEKLQIKSNVSYKIVVFDQFGDNWLFKAGPYSATDGAIATYRIYSFLGIDTPPVFPISFVVNGLRVDGSIQKLYKTVPNKKFISYLGQNLATNNYFALNHAMAYLILNNHVHPGQFILPAEPRNGVEAIRVDNSINWFLFDDSRLQMRYHSPTLLHIPQSGFDKFWEFYFANFVNLENPFFNFKERPKDFPTFKNLLTKKPATNPIDFSWVFQHIVFYSMIPDVLLKNILAPGVNNDMEMMANSKKLEIFYRFADLVVQLPPPLFVSKMVNRKNTSIGEFKKFYGSIAKLTGQQVHFDEKLNEVFLKEKFELLQHRIQELKLEKTKIVEKVPLEQDEIVLPISYSLYNITEPLFNVSFVPMRLRQGIFNRVISDLEAYLLSTKYEIEKVPAQVALENIKVLKKALNENSDFTKMWSSFLNYHELYEKDKMKALHF